MVQPNADMQESEIAAGVAWFKNCNAEQFKCFFDRLNDAEPDDMVKFPDVYLSVIRSLALIGLFEVTQRAAQGGSQ